MRKHTEKRVPELRFKGFTDDWEHKKLSDVSKVNSGRDYKHLEAGHIPVYGTGGYMLSVNESLSEIDGIGIGRKGTINKPYLLKAPFWTVDTLFYVTPHQSTDINFLLYIFNRISWKKYDESTGVPSLSKSTIENISIFIPKLSEQIKIGSLLEKLDNLITLYQRKNSLLNNYKRQLVRQLIPVDDSKNYDEVSLEKLLTEKIIKHQENEEYPLVSLTVEKGVTPKTERYERGQLIKGNKNTKIYKATEYNDIVYNPANLKFGAISRNKFGKAVFSPIYITFEVNKNNVLPEYLELIITQPTFLNKALRFQQGTVYERQSVSPNDLLKLRIVLPDKNTQKKLSVLVNKYETMITSSIDFLKYLSNFKKELLNRLYI